MNFSGLEAEKTIYDYILYPYIYMLDRISGIPASLQALWWLRFSAMVMDWTSSPHLTGQRRTQIGQSPPLDWTIL